MTNEVAKSTTINIVPVQGVFGPEPNYTLVSLIGPAGSEFYPNINPNQSGLNITNSTINSSVIGGVTPAVAHFTTATATNAPTTNNDLVNKAYADAISAGLNFKQPVVAATTVNITLSGAQSIDSVSVTAGQRVLVKNQTNQADNGIYVASNTAWSRATDADSWTELTGAFCYVEPGGTTNGGTAWYCTILGGGTLGVTPVTWTNFALTPLYYAGTGLTLSNFVFSITNTGVTAASYGSASKTLAATVNAQGQLTSLSATDIAINGNQITSGTVGSSYISGNYSGITGLGTITSGTWNGSTIGVAYGGTGATTFTAGYLKANGTSAFSTVSSIPSSDVSGLGTMATQNANNVAITGGAISGLSSPLAVASGGTGADTLTGYVKGSGTSALTAATTIPNTDITGLGTMSTQNASSVAITGGTESAVSHTGDTIADYLNFTNVTAPTYSQGRVWYDSTYKTLAYYNDVSTNAIHVGHDLIVKVINNTGSTIADGAPVYITSTTSGQTYPNVALAKADSAATSAVIGLASGAIANGAVGYVTAQGTIDTVNTSSYTVGQVLYLSPYSAGQLMNTIPPTGITVQVGVVTYVDSSAGQIYVKQTTPLNVPASIISGTVAVANGGTGIASYTAGDVLYASGATTLTKLGIGTAGQVLTVNGGATAPTWATATSAIAITDDTTTNATRYLTFVDATTGSVSGEYVSSTKLQFNPSTGLLTATGFSGAGTNLTGTASSLSIGGNAATATQFAVTDNTSTNATFYPVFTAASTGNNAGTVSSTKLQFNPSTGALTASQLIIAP